MRRTKILGLLIFAILVDIGQAQTNFQFHINHIATEVTNNGAMLWRNNAYLQTTWPYYSRYFDLASRTYYQESWGVWVGAQNFIGVNDSIPSTAVVASGNFMIDYNDIVPLSLQERVKYPYPVVRVTDGVNSQSEVYDNAVVVPSLTCDEQIESDWTTSLGITVQLKTYAYASAPNQNYIIYDYKFINTGNVDSNPNTKELKRKLTGVWFGFPFSTDIKPKFGGKDYNDYYRYYGASFGNWVNGDKTADSARVLYCWNGPTGSTNEYYPDPVTRQPQMPGFYGVGVLHADSVANLGFGANDDASQPRTVSTSSSDVTSGPSRYQALSQGGSSDINGIGAENLMLGFGPYDMGINQDVEIVLVQIIDGISPEVGKSLGMQLLSGQITQDQYLQEIRTGKDSLFKSLYNAQLAYNHGYRIPLPPPSPDSLTITTGIGRNTLNWSSNAENSTDPLTHVRDFSGYRVYRAAISPENTWEKIFECGGNSGVPITHTFVDTNLILGFNYYYAVTAFDDGRQNSFYPGVSLESSCLTSTAYIGAAAARPPATTEQGFQQNIRVVPNPFNIKSQNFGNPYDPNSTENNKLLFVGLPGQCTIKIYTVYGDLVKTIYHTNGLGSESWNQITDSNQFIVSGLYIAAIQSKLGNAIVKFVVIR